MGLITGDESAKAGGEGERMLTENLGEEEMKGENVKEGNEWKLGNRTNGFRLKTHGERRGRWIQIKGKLNVEC